MNVIVLVGQVIELPYLRETPSGYQCATMVLKVDRPFANSDGVYEADEIAVTLWKGIAQTTCEVCALHDVVAVKGRLTTRTHNKDGVIYRNYEVVAEKGFLHQEGKLRLPPLFCMKPPAVSIL